MMPTMRYGGFSSGLVTTIIPVFNRGEMLREAVFSVLGQTYRPIEIIIVDDGSTDDTPRVCEELADQHPGIVRVLRQENAGPGVARQTGLDAANGEYIQYLDSDDLLLSEKFEKQVTALERNQEAGVAYCKIREYHVQQKPTNVPARQSGRMIRKLFPLLLYGRIWTTEAPLYRRSVCEAVGSWTKLRQEEDWEYECRVAAMGTSLVWCDEFLCDHRHHDGPRAGGKSLRDPQKMRGRMQAHQLIYSHARRAGIDSNEPAMQHFARRLFLLSRQCGTAGLTEEAQKLFVLSQEASGSKRARAFDYRTYQALAKITGWKVAGRLSEYIDRMRQYI